MSRDIRHANIANGTGCFIRRGTPCPRPRCGGELEAEDNGVDLVLDSGAMLGGGYEDGGRRNRAPYIGCDLFRCPACGYRVVAGFNAKTAAKRLQAFVEGEASMGPRGQPVLDPDMRAFLNRIRDRDIPRRL